jgi:multicomponent Na+:H+ antiporter subunit D
LPGVMLAATTGMVAVTVALTALAGPLYAVADRAAIDLLDRRPYLTAVFGEGTEQP